jgi:biotin carboxyl carrier protein
MVAEEYATVEVNGTKYNVQIEKVVKKSIHPLIKAAAAIAKTSPAPAPKSPTGEPVVSRPVLETAASTIQSPLPGVILSIAVNVGDSVKKGQKLLILEAMKMENNINADRDGKIVELKVKTGDSILEGADLVVIG